MTTSLRQGTRRDLERGGDTDTGTGPTMKHPVEADVTTRADQIKTSNHNKTKPDKMDDEDFNHNVTYEVISPTSSILIHKVVLLIFPLGLYMEKLKSDPKFK